MPPQLVSITEDLYFGMKIEAAAKGQGLAFAWLDQADGAAERLSNLSAQAPEESLTIFVDLSTRLPWREIYAQAPQSEAIDWIGYGAHVEETLLAEARDLGLGRVMPRSKFTKALPALLSTLKKEEAS